MSEEPWLCEQYPLFACMAGAGFQKQPSKMLKSVKRRQDDDIQGTQPCVRVSIHDDHAHMRHAALPIDSITIFWMSHVCVCACDCLCVRCSYSWRKICRCLAWHQRNGTKSWCTSKWAFKVATSGKLGMLMMNALPLSPHTNDYLKFSQCALDDGRGRL